MDYATYIHWSLTGAIAIWAAWLQFKGTQTSTDEVVNLKLKLVVLEERVSNLVDLTKDINHKIDKVICNE